MKKKKKIVVKTNKIDLTKIKKIKNQHKCDCGKLVSKGSVFCPTCKAGIEQGNTKTLIRSDRAFNKQF